jgi:hypothetical protein
MVAPRAFQSYAEFERELIRPSLRVGWSVDELEESDHVLDFDLDPFEKSLLAAEESDED